MEQNIQLKTSGTGGRDPMIAPELADTSDDVVNSALETWILLTGSEPPIGLAAHCQREWASR